jgi:hypothetical protein
MTYQLTSSDQHPSPQLTTPSSPTAPGNRDFADYTAWLAAGNTPLPAPPPPPPAPDYFTFWESLLQTSAYQSIRTQSASSLLMNTAATEFIALIGDAKMGRPIEPAIQLSILTVLSAGTFTEAELLEFQAALVAGNLDTIYTLEAPES